MSNGYSTDLRKRVLEHYDRHNQSQAKVAQLFKVASRTIGNWLRLRRDLGNYELKERPRQRQARKISKEALLLYVNEHPDHFLWEIGKHFGASSIAAHKACKKYGLSRKKNAFIQRKVRAQKASVFTGNREAKS